MLFCSMNHAVQSVSQLSIIKVIDSNLTVCAFTVIPLSFSTLSLSNTCLLMLPLFLGIVPVSCIIRISQVLESRRQRWATSKRLQSNRIIIKIHLKRCTHSLTGLIKLTFRDLWLIRTKLDNKVCLHTYMSNYGEIPIEKLWSVLLLQV